MFSKPSFFLPRGLSTCSSLCLVFSSLSSLSLLILWGLFSKSYHLTTTHPSHLHNLNHLSVQDVCPRLLAHFLLQSLYNSQLHIYLCLCFHSLPFTDDKLCKMGISLIHRFSYPPWCLVSCRPECARSVQRKETLGRGSWVRFLFMCEMNTGLLASSLPPMAESDEVVLFEVYACVHSFIARP